MDPFPLLVPSLAAIVVLVACSAFFSSSESAVFSLPEGWIDETATGGSPDAVALGRLREDPHRLLVTLLVGNNLVNVAISSVVTLLVAEFVPSGLAVLVATATASAVILVFGEIVPKSYGLANAETWSLRVARPIAAVGRALGPVVALFDWVTRWLTRVVGGDRAIEEQYLEE